MVRLGEEPVPGARVTVLDESGKEVAAARAGADGRFRLAVPRGGRRRLFAVAPGVGRDERFAVDGGQDFPEIRLDLYPARVVRGRVTDVEGRPVTAAEVRNEPLSTSTGPGGRFELHGVGMFATSLEVRRTKSAPVRAEVSEGGDAEVAIALPPPGAAQAGEPAEARGSRRLRGVLFAVGPDGGRRGLPGIEVGVGYTEDLWTTVTSTTVTGPDGRFAFEGLDDDDRDLLLRNERWHVVERREVGGMLELRAERTRDVEGTVVGPDGAPMAGVHVRGGRAGAVFTDGRFRVPEVGAGAWDLTIEARGFEKRVIEGVPAGAGLGEVGLTRSR